MTGCHTNCRKTSVRLACETFDTTWKWITKQHAYEFYTNLKVSKKAKIEIDTIKHRTWPRTPHGKTFGCWINCVYFKRNYAEIKLDMICWNSVCQSKLKINLDFSGKILLNKTVCLSCLNIIVFIILLISLNQSKFMQLFICNVWFVLKIKLTTLSLCAYCAI